MTTDEVRFQLIQTYASALQSMWNYFLTMVVGVVAIVAALLGTHHKLEMLSGIFLIAALIVFGLVNFLSMRHAGNLIRSNIAKTSDEEISAVLGSQGFSNRFVWFQPLGWISAVAFIIMKTKWL